MDFSVRSVMPEQWAELQYLLGFTVLDAMNDAYAEWANADTRLFGGPMPIATQEISTRGFVKKYKLSPADNAVAMGPVSADTAVPSTWSLPAFSNYRLSTRDLNVLAATIMVEDAVEDLLKDKAVLAETGVMKADEAILQVMRRLATYVMVGREGFVGVLSNDPGSPTDDSTNNQYVLALNLTAKAYVPGLQKGSLLQACATPTFGSPVVTLRNFTSPMRVISDVTAGYDSTTARWYRVTVACPYTSATKGTVNTELTALTTGDSLGPWAGATAGVTSMPEGGFNHGLMGYRFSGETNGSTVFQDAEDVGGAMTNALQTNQDTPRSVDRNATSGEWSYLNPGITEGAAATLASMFTAIDNNPLNTAAMNLLMKNAGPQTLMAWANPLIINNLIRCLGAPNLSRDLAQASTEAIRSQYGIAGPVVYQSVFTPQPIILQGHQSLMADQIMVTTAGGPLFELDVPGPGRWVSGENGIWSRRRNSSGGRQFSREATYYMWIQMTPKVRLDNRMHIIRNIGLSLS